MKNKLTFKKMTRLLISTNLLFWVMNAVAVNCIMITEQESSNSEHKGGDGEDGNRSTNNNTSTTCSSTPAKAGLTASTSTSVSHRAGEDCLGCHSSTGGTSPFWKVAGTLYSASGATTVAAAGSTINNVGGTTVTVDSCGNFYSTTTISAISASQPGSTSSNKSMGKTLGTSDGSCNRSGCHTSASVGILY